MKENDCYEDYKTNRKGLNVIIKNSTKVLIILSICTVLGELLYKLKFNYASVILIFTLGVLFCAMSTEGYIYGVASSILVVIFFNFFFTDPKYTLAVYDKNYILTFFAMLISSIVVSTLTSKIKRSIEISQIKEKNIKLLYDLNQSLLRSRGNYGILETCKYELGKIIDRPMVVAIKNNDVIDKVQIKNDIGQINLDDSEIKNLMLGNILDEYTTRNCKDKKLYYYPIKVNNNMFGIISIACKVDESLTKNENILIESALTQITFALEREALYKKSKEASLSAESEKIRGNLLRSISHDLRTPLTGIIGSASAIIENYYEFDDNLKIEFIKNIYEDATWLSRSVENVISLTKMDEDEFKLKKEMVVVDDIIGESIAIIKKYSDNHTIKVTLPDELLLINVDGLLIEKVLINLIDNAIRHTPHNSTINVKSKKDDGYIYFEVEDNGGGIAAKDIQKIFERFYSKSSDTSTERRGIGLGLSICKSIVELHDGKISVYNNNLGGATFRVQIPN